MKTKISSQRSAADVEVLKKELLLSGFCKIERHTLRHKRFDGTFTPIYTRDFMQKPKVAAALPYDPVNNQVVLIEQFRIGALGVLENPWLIEVVAGIMDKNGEEYPELIAREMREEACLEILDLMPVYEYIVTPGCSTEIVKLYCAKVDATKAPEFCGVRDEHEDIRVIVTPVAEAFALVHSGQIKNALAIIALQWLELNLSAVQKKWRSS